MAFSRGFRGRSRSPSKRLTAWADGPNNTLEGQAAVGNNGWTTGVVLAAESAATIVRIRGLLSLYLDLSTAAGDGFSGAVGLGIVTQQAFDAGSASLPDPFDDSFWAGWMWHSFWHLHGIAAQSQGQDVAVNAATDVLRIPIDTKAMRKFDLNQVLVGVIKLNVETGIAGLRFIADTRVLVKLS